MQKRFMKVGGMMPTEVSSTPTMMHCYTYATMDDLSRIGSDIYIWVYRVHGVSEWPYVNELSNYTGVCCHNRRVKAYNFYVTHVIYRKVPVFKEHDGHTLDYGRPETEV